MKVYVTPYGLCKFRITEIENIDGVIHYKGQYRLPKGHVFTDGGKWGDLDYWFKLNEILYGNGEDFTYGAEKYTDHNMGLFGHQGFQFKYPPTDEK